MISRSLQLISAYGVGCILGFLAGRDHAKQKNPHTQAHEAHLTEQANEEIMNLLSKSYTLIPNKNVMEIEEKLKIAESYIYQPSDFREYRETLKHKGLPDSDPTKEIAP